MIRKKIFPQNTKKYSSFINILLCVVCTLEYFACSCINEWATSISAASSSGCMSCCCKEHKICDIISELFCTLLLLHEILVFFGGFYVVGLTQIWTLMAFSSSSSCYHGLFIFWYIFSSEICCKYAEIKEIFISRMNNFISHNCDSNDIPFFKKVLQTFS